MPSFVPSLSRLRFFALAVLVAFSWRKLQVLSVTDDLLESIATENFEASKGHNIFAQRSMSSADEDDSGDAGRGISANTKDGDFASSPGFSGADVDAPPVSDDDADDDNSSSNNNESGNESGTETVRTITSVTTGLYVPGKIGIVFYDWTTLVDANFAGKVLLMCDPTYDYAETGCDGALDGDGDSCAGPNGLSDALLSQENPEEFVANNAWGGQERLERMERHFEYLKKAGVELVLLDEIWGCLSNGGESGGGGNNNDAVWVKYLSTVLNLSGLASYFPSADSIRVTRWDNTGPAIVRDVLEERGYDAAESIYVDNGPVDFVQTIVEPLESELVYVGAGVDIDDTIVDVDEGRLVLGNMYSAESKGVTGLVDGNDLGYIEDRASMTELPNRAKGELLARPSITSTVTREALLPGTDGRYEETPKVVMYDFDTIVADVYYPQTILRDYCDCPGYDSCDCTGEDDMSWALEMHPDPFAFLLQSFGGPENARLLRRHFEIMGPHVDSYITATSWYSVPAAGMRNFIYASLKYLNMHEYFEPPEERILVADDPGPLLPATEIRTLMREALGDRGDLVNPRDSIYVTHYYEELVFAVGESFDFETLYVQTFHGGVVQKDLLYLEGRAGASDALATAEELAGDAIGDLIDAVTASDPPSPTAAPAALTLRPTVGGSIEAVSAIPKEVGGDSATNAVDSSAASNGRGTKAISVINIIVLVSVIAFMSAFGLGFLCLHVASLPADK